MLELKNFIAKGATRICFQHPKDENLCIKVVVRFKEIDVLNKELKVYNYIKQELKDYIVEYQNGEAVTTKQLVSKNSYVRLKVKVEFRKDITASDLPAGSETFLKRSHRQ